jgi:hypothetical protein
MRKSNSSHGDAGTSAPQEELEVEVMTKKQRKKMRCGTRRGGKGEPQAEPDENWMIKKQRKKLVKDQDTVRNAAALDQLKKDSSKVCNGKQSAAKCKGAQESAGSG